MDGPGAAAAAAEVYGFPATLTSFIGREEAVRDVAGLLEERRLVTVTGPGGMGKTRLAGQVARQVAARFTDGAWLAELAPVRDPAQVTAVVAAATLRAYGAELLTESGEQDEAAVALARYALRVAGQAAAGLRSDDGEPAAARWLDAEDATMRQALAWAVPYDPATALWLAVALAWWWLLRG